MINVIYCSKIHQGPIWLRNLYEKNGMESSNMVNLGIISGKTLQHNNSHQIDSGNEVKLK